MSVEGVDREGGRQPGGEPLRTKDSFAGAPCPVLCDCWLRDDANVFLDRKSEVKALKREKGPGAAEKIETQTNWLKKQAQR